MTAEFSGRSYLISGGGKGLGRAIAIGLASLGATIGIGDIDAEALQECERTIAGAGGRIHTYCADLSRQDAFREMGDAFAATVGGLDGMINNASYLVYEPLESIAEDTLDRMLGAGFKSAVWGSQVLLKHRKPGVAASIINFSSPVAFKGYPMTAIYSAVKSATTSLTRTLAAELGPQNIRVNAIAPGSVPTPGALKYVDAAEYARRAATIPMRRLGREEDVVAGIKFLLSDAAAFVNGAVLAVDGGIIAAA
jgi:meso-butanediol dehydrogenase / (S,S)-butanediol dehydrogenase / diacetyl reductase